MTRDENQLHMLRSHAQYLMHFVPWEGGRGTEEDDDDDDYDLDEACESGVQLGMVVEWEASARQLLFTNTDWHDWDGGKAGGWPVRDKSL